MVIREAIAQASADLKKAGIETPSLDASLLLAHILKISRSSLTARTAEPLSEENVRALRALVQRRLNGECIAYITGKKEFRGLEFLVNSSVLVPRPDTETLVEAVVGNREWGIGNGEESIERAIRVLDLCTGSGAVAISLKNEMPTLEVHATDISAEALEVAKTNAERLLGENKIHFYHGDLYDALPQTGRAARDKSLAHYSPCQPLLSATPCSNLSSTPLRGACQGVSLLTSLFSLIIANPPYIPSDEINTLCAEVQHEPRLALDGGLTGLEIITRIIDGSRIFLQRGGSLLLEADPRQMKKITSLLAEKGFNDIKLYNDLSGQERVIGGTFE